MSVGAVLYPYVWVREAAYERRALGEVGDAELYITACWDRVFVPALGTRVVTAALTASGEWRCLD